MKKRADISCRVWLNGDFLFRFKYSFSSITIKKCTSVFFYKSVFFQSAAIFIIINIISPYFSSAMNFMIFMNCSDVI